MEVLTTAKKAIKPEKDSTTIPWSKMSEVASSEGPGDVDDDRRADKQEAEWDGGYDPLSDPEEMRVLLSALESFRSVS